MTSDIRVKILIARSEQYFSIMRTTLFSLAAIAAVIELGSGGYSAPLVTLAIAVSAYGILAGGTALNDIDNLRSDMDESIAGTAYGAAVKARNLPALKMISAVLIGLVGLAEVITILS